MRTATIVAFISELIETHMDKCESDPSIPHVVSYHDQASSNISDIATYDSTILLTLDNGDAFHVSISKES